jgi:hypothetical protein
MAAELRMRGYQRLRKELGAQEPPADVVRSRA